MTDLPSWAARGQQCVCINDDWDVPLPVPTRVPMLNEILTIADVRLVVERHAVLGCWFLPGIFLAFDEIPLTQSAGDVDGANIWWRIGSFRPLIRIRKSRAHDVALFEQFTTKVGAKA